LDLKTLDYLTFFEIFKLDLVHKGLLSEMVRFRAAHLIEFLVLPYG